MTNGQANYLLLNQTNAPVYIRVDQFVTTCSVINVKNAMSLDNEPVTGHDKSFSYVVARRATIEPFLVARPKRWLPRICYR